MRILFIEDDTSLVSGLKKSLAQAGIAVDHEENGLHAFDVADPNDYAVIVLDLDLPGLRGDEVLGNLRRRGSSVPVLMLTAMHEVSQKVRCFNLGADDYLTKPFEPEEFEARIRALARRGSGHAEPTLVCGPLSLETHKARAFLHGEPLTLRRRELTVLGVLMANAGKLVRKERLISEIFSFDEAVAPNAVEVYVARLRQKLKPDGPTIKTVWGLGYLMEAM